MPESAESQQIKALGQLLDTAQAREEETLLDILDAILCHPFCMAIVDFKFQGKKTLSQYEQTHDALGLIAEALNLRESLLQETLPPEQGGDHGTQVSDAQYRKISRVLKALCTILEAYGDLADSGKAPSQGVLIPYALYLLSI